MGVTDSVWYDSYRRSVLIPGWWLAGAAPASADLQRIVRYGSTEALKYGLSCESCDIAVA